MSAKAATKTMGWVSELAYVLLCNVEAVDCLYSLYCREEVFSETYIQDREYNRLESSLISALSPPGTEVETRYLGPPNKHALSHVLCRVRSTTPC